MLARRFERLLKSGRPSLPDDKLVLSSTAMPPRRVTPPAKPLPELACDTHAHVFGPYELFPLAAERRYTPPLAPFEDYTAMLERAGFARGVVVHASANGYDCGGTLDALARGAGRLRGIVVVPLSTPDADLASMQAVGVRGIRFTETAALMPGQINVGTLTLNDASEWAPRLKELGWHAQIWANCRRFVEVMPALLRLNIPLVLDHMGYFDAGRGVGDPDFQALLRGLESGRVWVKMTAIRNSKGAPLYPEIRSFHEALLAAAPDRLLWGSDWPYIGYTESSPDVGALIDLFDSWTPDDVLRNKILVANPAALYGFDR
jgi:2-pyrone-4,6-dicarboxylate lactonase